LENVDIRYRTWFKGKPPQKIKLQIPGWAGQPGYSDGSEPQPWHCKPFVDGSTYGLELLYPFENDLVVRTSYEEVVTFNGDFTEHEKSTGMMPPFLSFAPHHYGFTSSLDLMTPPGIVTRIEPHPRFYTDRTGTVPIAVAGHLETEWWSRIFFIAMKSPLPGCEHVFRCGEPYAQLLFLPKERTYNVIKMTEDEIADRTKRDEKVGKHSKKLCTHRFADHLGRHFDNKYKVMSKINTREGIEAVDDFIEETVGPEVKAKKIAGFKLKCKKPI
jgi:hypothetical protein